MIPPAERREVRNLMTRLATARKAEDNREIASTEQPAFVIEAIVADAILRAVPGARADAEGVRDITRLLEALLAIERTTGMVAGGDRTFSHESSIRQAAERSGVPMERALAIPAPVVARMIDLVR